MYLSSLLFFLLSGVDRRVEVGGGVGVEVIGLKTTNQ
jgi:hypothetical protein